MYNFALMKILLLLLLTVIGTELPAQWTRTSGPEGSGETDTFYMPEGIAQHRDIIEHQGKLFVCTADGLYMSSDSTASWKQVWLAGKRVSHIAVNVVTMYASVGDTLYSTSNEGLSWKMVKVFGATRIDQLLIVNGVIYIVVYSGNNEIYFSTTNGNTWIKTNSVNSPSGEIVSLFKSGNSIFAATNRDWLFKTSDKGTNWTGTGTYTPIPKPYIFVAKNVNDTIYVGGNKCFSYSGNDGRSWRTPKCVGLDSVNGFFINDINTLGNRIFASIYSGGNAFYSGSTTLVYSDDKGDNWHKVNTGSFVPTKETAQAITVIGSDCYIQTPTGIYRSTDTGATWTARNNGLPLLTSTIAFSDNNALHILGPSGVYKTNDGGDTWAHESAPNIIWQRLRGSLDFKGSHYLYGDSSISYTNDYDVIDGYNSSAVVTFNDELVRTDFNTIQRSSDGKTWEYLWLDAATENKAILNLISSGTCLILVLRETDYGTISYYRSTDGNTWTKVFSDPYGYYPSCSATHKGSFYIGTKNFNDWSASGLLRSDDDGLTWTRDASIGDAATIDVLYSTGDYLFCYQYGSDSLVHDGLSMRKENSGPFQFVGEGLPHITSLKLHTDGSLYAGGSGVWKRPLVELGIVNDLTSLPIQTVHPNPATNFIIMDEDATLTLFTSTGMEVFTTKAVHDERVSLPKLASGVYIAKIETKSGVKSAKIVIR